MGCIIRDGKRLKNGGNIERLEDWLYQFDRVRVDYKIVVVDSRSRDGTLEIARKYCGDNGSVIRYEWPGNFSKFRNRYIREARKIDADLLVTLDRDEEYCDPDMVRDVLRRLLKMDKYDAFCLRYKQCGVDDGSARTKPPRIIRIRDGVEYVGRVWEIPSVYDDKMLFIPEIEIEHHNNYTPQIALLELRKVVVGGPEAEVANEFLDGVEEKFRFYADLSEREINEIRNAVPLSRDPRELYFLGMRYHSLSRTVVGDGRSKIVVGPYEQRTRKLKSQISLKEEERIFQKAYNQFQIKRPDDPEHILERSILARLGECCIRGSFEVEDFPLYRQGFDFLMSAKELGSEMAEELLGSMLKYNEQMGLL